MDQQLVNQYLSVFKQWEGDMVMILYSLRNQEIQEQEFDMALALFNQWRCWGSYD